MRLSRHPYHLGLGSFVAGLLLCAVPAIDVLLVAVGVGSSLVLLRAPRLALVAAALLAGGAVVGHARLHAIDAPDRFLHAGESFAARAWVLEWPRADKPPRPLDRVFHDDWTERDWGEITEQDYTNLGEVQAGMRSPAWAGARLNPRQEGNILHMHRVIDRYLLADENGHG